MVFKKFTSCLIILLYCTLQYAQDLPENKNLILWYKKPAAVWEEALPLGNGKTGAMVFGGVQSETYQLNDNTLWSGYPISGNNSNGQKYLEPLREAVFKGDYKKAATFWKKMQGPYSARYLPLGEIKLDFGLEDTIVTAYKRELNLNNAISRVSYKMGDVTFTRETFISHPDKVMAIKITADHGHQVSLNASLSSKLHFSLNKLNRNDLVLSGKAPKFVAHRSSVPQQIVYSDSLNGEGVNFEMRLKLVNYGGQLNSHEKVLSVEKADSVVLYLTEATSFNGFNKSPGLEGKDAGKEALSLMNKVEHKTYGNLKRTHIEDYQKLFSKVAFTLGENTSASDIPTDKRLQNFEKSSTDKALVALYFQYGRYLLISSSRSGEAPANLQGIWNPHVQPPWGSNYTININTEMNYWPAESTNLSTCTSPLFSFIKNLSVNGAVTARVNYGVKQGWTAHHNSDIWAKTSPTGGYEWDPRGAARWSAWPMAGAWLSTHLWEHYLYTGDREFLKNKAYPLMKGASQFMLKWLVEDSQGNLVTNPSTSPEHEFKIGDKSYEISMASTMDMAIIRQLFGDCIQASEALNIDDKYRDSLQTARQKLYPYHIGKYGQLQEWFKDWDDPNDHHRHLSHLFGLFPGDQITVAETPELAAAAKNSLLQRGDESTGWSMAWKVNWWSRLNDGDHAYKILKDGLHYINPAANEVKMSGGGTYPNLFDAHPPFQIDGNLGGTAAIAEMLVQSYGDEIKLLPALPKEWPTGMVSGLKTRGNFEVSLKWDHSRFSRVVISSLHGGNCRVRSHIPLRLVEKDYHRAKGKNTNPLMIKSFKPLFINTTKAPLPDLIPNGGYVIDFSTEKGKKYTLEPLKE